MTKTITNDKALIEQFIPLLNNVPPGEGALTPEFIKLAEFLIEHAPDPEFQQVGEILGIIAINRIPSTDLSDFGTALGKNHSIDPEIYNTLARAIGVLYRNDISRFWSYVGPLFHDPEYTIDLDLTVFARDFLTHRHDCSQLVFKWMPQFEEASGVAIPHRVSDFSHPYSDCLPGHVRFVVAKELSHYICKHQDKVKVPFDGDNDVKFVDKWAEALSEIIVTEPISSQKRDEYKVSMAEFEQFMGGNICIDSLFYSAWQMIQWQLAGHKTMLVSEEDISENIRVCKHLIHDNEFVVTYAEDG